MNQKHKEKSNCIVCNKEMDYVPEYCCSGHECGCYGKPIEPPICSDECFDKLMSEIKHGPEA